MTDRIAVVLIHADGATQRCIKEALPESEYAVTLRSQTDNLPRELAALRPRVALIDAAVVTADQALREAVLGLDPPCLLLALAALGAGASATDVLEREADDVIALPLADTALRARLRAGLRLVRRTLAAHEVRGELGPAGPLGIIKHCEDHRLSGRLTVEGAGRRYSAEFFGGELMGTGSEPPAEDGDDLAGLMSLSDGCYVFVQAAVDPLAATPPARSSPATGQAATGTGAILPAPDPIVTTIADSPQGVAFDVRTTGENRPLFTISTVILRDGQELRETETSWPHPIASEADLAQARLQMAQQHERVTVKLREVAESRPPRPAATLGVDGTLLSWALHFVVEQAWADLGTTVTASLLGRTQSALARRWPHLARFHIGDKAQVTFDLGRGPTLASDAVEAVAAWLAAFLYLARRVAPLLARLDVRESTVLMVTALDSVGFYAAFAAAASSCERDGVRLDAGASDRRAASRVNG